MPGLAGFYSKNNKPELLQKMVSAMNHYQYKTEVCTDHEYHLARIHMNKTNTQPQPVYKQDKEQLLIMQGEIFSYKNYESKDIYSDSAFLLDLLINEGISCLDKINGHYCACYINKKEGELILIADRFGTLPLYYAQLSSDFIFASEVKSILTHNIEKQINDDALSEMFHLCHLFGHKTMFTHIYQLPEASYLRYKNGNISLHKYWDFPYNEEVYRKKKFTNKEIHNYIEELAELMDKSMSRLSYKNREKILISLSGGLDSRYVAAFMHKYNIHPLVAYTMGPENSEDQMYAKIIAKKLGIEHHPYEVNPQNIWKHAKEFSFLADNMTMIYGPIQGFKPISDFADRFDITISSQMCDAIFGGNLWRKRLQLLERKKEHDDESQDIITNIFSLIPDSSLKFICTSDFYEKIEGKFDLVSKDYISRYTLPLHCYINLLMNEHGRRGTFSGNLMNNYFLDTRMPSYDNDVMDFAYNLPIELRKNQYIYRAAFTKLFPDLAKVKRERYNLPVSSSNFRYATKIWETKIINTLKLTSANKIVNMFKKFNRPTYVSYNNWFKNELHQNAQKILLDRKTLNRGLFVKEGLMNLLNDHMHPLKDHSKLIWQVINLEYFFRNFID